MKSHPPTYHLPDNFDKKLTDFVNNLLSDGFEVFADEFKNIDSYVKMANADRTDRDDHDLRRTEKERYLLELISFKVFDQLNREEFNNRKKTLIIMPDCLSIHEFDCQKTDEKYGDICQMCHPDCQAYQIMELAEKYDVPVMYSKRKLTDQLEHHSKKLGDTAVIGIACVMMLANGMRTAHEVGIPARGVLLNFSGCEHWNDEPFASEFCFESLKKILEEKYGPRD